MILKIIIMVLSGVVAYLIFVAVVEITKKKARRRILKSIGENKEEKE